MMMMMMMMIIAEFFRVFSRLVLGVAAILNLPICGVLDYIIVACKSQGFLLGLAASSS
jgi:hypothetical protein